jgi:hypothetical protein
MGARGGALRSAGLRAPTPQRIATFLVGSRLKLTMVRKKQGTPCHSLQHSAFRPYRITKRTLPPNDRPCHVLDHFAWTSSLKSAPLPFPISANMAPSRSVQ